MSFGGGEKLTGLLSDPTSRGILGASAGLLAAGAPRTGRPVSLGEAISMGLLSGGQAFDEALAAKQQRDAAKALQDFRLEQFDYRKSRDTLADEIAADNTEYSRGRDKIADQRAAAEAELLAKLRTARYNKLTQPDKPPRQTRIAQINQDVENGYISEEVGKALIADLLKPEDYGLLSPEGKLASDRANRPDLFPPEQKKLDEAPTFEPVDIDFRTAFGGDIPGLLTDALNIGAGAVGSVASEERLRQSARLNNLNESLRGLLAKRSSKVGSKFSLEQIDNILPKPSTSNVKGAEMYRALLPDLKKMLVEAQATLDSDDETTQTYKTQARRAVSELPGVIATIENSLSEFDASRGQNPRGSRRNRRDTVDSSQGPIKFERVDDGTD